MPRLASVLALLVAIAAPAGAQRLKKRSPRPMTASVVAFGAPAVPIKAPLRAVSTDSVPLRPVIAPRSALGKWLSAAVLLLGLLGLSVVHRSRS